MVELTPLQIVRNMAKNITSRRPAGSGVGAMGEINSLGQSVGGKDPRLDNFSVSLDPYQLDLGGEISEDLTGYRIPIASDLGSAVNAYLHGVQMNKYRDAIREELDAQLESVGIKKGTSEYWKEYTKRMPDVGSPEAMVEFGVGAAIGAPVVKGSFGALKALYNMMPKRNKEMQRIEEKAGTAIDQAEIDASKPQ
tara:strand:- start:123 stop:707 length:585 start_codon:yes stop_codon:yes gene_type:complete